jgi:hypothetical protein
MAVFWVVAPCSLVVIALMMEAARTTETLVNFYQTTRRYNPEDSHLRTHHRENLKAYDVLSITENNCFDYLQDLRIQQCVIKCCYGTSSNADLTWIYNFK